MQTRLCLISLATLGALALTLGTPAARAGCVGEAAGEFRVCRADCKEAFQAAKDACLDRDHACVEACRAEREDCRAATGIDTAIAACNAQLARDKQTCKDTNPPGDQRDQCIDQAQVVAFQCRDSAREQARPALMQCRQNFRHCAKACAPNVPPDPAGAEQCRRQAKQDLGTCDGNCLEDFQVAKDACQNRDHACVEQCREDLQSCRQPVVDQLDAEIAACNATRDSAINNCKQLYAEDDPRRDTCIDNAQVAAFECRDQAREDARPGLNACRAQFKTCVQACPPPASGGS